MSLNDYELTNEIIGNNQGRLQKCIRKADKKEVLLKKGVCNCFKNL
jgi:hypothetical protein